MSGMNKAERLSELKRLYVQRVYSDIELAEKLGSPRGGLNPPASRRRVRWGRSV